MHRVVLMIVGEGLGSAARRVHAREHRALTTALVRADTRRVEWVTHLDEQRGACLAAGVDAAAMDRQITKEEHVPGLRRAGRGVLDFVLLGIDVPPARRIMGKKAELVATRHDPNTAFLQRRGIEVHDGGDHGVVGVWEKRRVLVHRKRAALLGRLDKHLGVVELDIGADNLRRHPREPLVHDEARQARIVELDIVAVLERGCFSALYVATRRAPGRVRAPIALHVEPVRQVMQRLPVPRHLIFIEKSLHKHVAVLAIETQLFVCEHDTSIAGKMPA